MSEDEVYEVVDLTEYARRHQWWSRVFGSNSGPIAEKYSSCAGYLFQRVGKIAATAVGGGFLLLQIANHTGYVQINWKKVEKDVTKPRSTSKNGRTSSKNYRTIPLTSFNSILIYSNGSYIRHIS
uniref:FUN14 domain containing 1 n=1 Tax=Neogobius melanostomus TaxID=47308 RepID=A0A8C6UST6_9GOBI